MRRLRSSLITFLLYYYLLLFGRNVIGLWHGRVNGRLLIILGRSFYKSTLSRILCYELINIVIMFLQEHLLLNWVGSRFFLFDLKLFCFRVLKITVSLVCRYTLNFLLLLRFSILNYIVVLRPQKSFKIHKLSLEPNIGEDNVPFLSHIRHCFIKGHLMFFH